MIRPAFYPKLVLGLGTSAQRLVQALELKFPRHSEHQDCRIETMNAYGVGYDGWDFDREKLKALLESAERVLFVVCGGGKTAGEIATFAAKYASSKAIRLDVLLSYPYSWEGSRRIAVATKLTENLRTIGAKVDVVDADPLYSDDMDSACEAFAALDKAMAKEVTHWIVQDK